MKHKFLYIFLIDTITKTNLCVSQFTQFTLKNFNFTTTKKNSICDAIYYQHENVTVFFIPVKISKNNVNSISFLPKYYQSTRIKDLICNLTHVDLTHAPIYFQTANTHISPQFLFCDFFIQNIFLIF